MRRVNSDTLTDFDNYMRRATYFTSYSNELRREKDKNLNQNAMN